MAKGTGSGESWGTRIGVILAVMGSAVGLGNFLRFPGKAAQYEGGAFMIPYFIALLVLGIPLAWAEWGMGRYGGVRGHNSTPGIYRTIWRNRAAPYFGVIGMLVPVVIYMYYVFIEAWCLSYAYYTATGALSLGNDSQAYIGFFKNFIGMEADGFLLGNGGVSPAVIALVLCFVLNFILIYRGLSKGIERFCLFAMPLLILCALVVLGRVLTLGTPDPSKPELNVLNGLGFMWNPKTEDGSFLKSLMNGQMWLEATGQIFFSLSVGFGIIITYASYLKKDDDVALSSLTSNAGNEFCEVALGGLITIPAAFIFLGAAGVAGRGTFDLGFMVLPQVFESMPGGRFVGTLFFFLLFLAAVTSSLSMLQPAIALLEEGLGLGRRASVAMLGFITMVGSFFVVYFSKNLMALDTMDFWVGTFCIFVLATFQTILFGWGLGIDKGMEEINRGASIRVPRLVGYVLKYVAPVYLSIVFIVWLYQQATAEKGNYFKALAEDRVAQMTVGFIILVAVLFMLLIAQSVKRWNKQEQLQSEAKS
ncbi:MAG: sodium:calcium symporter [Gammaproteobacteria bacterium]|nr:MAG: sodium:calcium symporter [Gammaproteobacteria bacterium]